MRSVLIYGDSNTHGAPPAGPLDQPRERFGPNERWPGVVRDRLAPHWFVIEEGLSGRTTVNDDPIEGLEKNGRTYLRPCLTSHAPLDLVIIMLGTNDLKIRFNKTAPEIAMGVNALVRDAKEMRPGPKSRVPEIMIVSPPPIREDLKGWESVFEQGRAKSLRLAEEYARVAEALEVHFFDAGSVVESSEIDGFHLDLPAHAALGRAIAEAIESIGWA
jgi:lysophospholipase L1-like esterase